MNFILALIALVLAVNGVQSQTTGVKVKAEVYAKVLEPQGKAVQTLFDAFTKNALTIAENDKKTLWTNVQKENSTIQGNVKSTIASLVASKNATLAAGAGLVGAAILGVQGKYDELATKLSKAYIISIDICRVHIIIFIGKFKAASAELNDRIVAIPEEKVNNVTYKDCIASAAKDIAAMYKAYDVAQKNCSKNFDAKNKIFLTKGSLVSYLIGNITLNAQAPIDLVKRCLKSNQVADVKALESSTACTIGSFVSCILEGIPATAAFSTSFQALIDAIVAAYVEYHTVSQECMDAAYSAFLSTFATIASNLVKCLTKP